MEQSRADVLREWMEKRGCSVTWVAQQVGLSRERVSGVLNEHKPFTDELAARLEVGVGLVFPDRAAINSKIAAEEARRELCLAWGADTRATEWFSKLAWSSIVSRRGLAPFASDLGMKAHLFDEYQSRFSETRANANDLRRNLDGEEAETPSVVEEILFRGFISWLGKGTTKRVAEHLEGTHAIEPLRTLIGWHEFFDAEKLKESFRQAATILALDSAKARAVAYVFDAVRDGDISAFKLNLTAKLDACRARTAQAESELAALRGPEPRGTLSEAERAELVEARQTYIDSFTKMRSGSDKAKLRAELNAKRKSFASSLERDDWARKASSAWREKGKELQEEIRTLAKEEVLLSQNLIQVALLPEGYKSASNVRAFFRAAAEDIVRIESDLVHDD